MGGLKWQCIADCHVLCLHLPKSSVCTWLVCSLLPVSQQDYSKAVAKSYFLYGKDRTWYKNQSIRSWGDLDSDLGMCVNISFIH